MVRVLPAVLGAMTTPVADVKLNVPEPNVSWSGPAFPFAALSADCTSGYVCVHPESVVAGLTTQ